MNHLHRHIIRIAALLVAAAILVPAAQAASNDGRSPDTKDAAFSAHHNGSVNYKTAERAVAGPPLNGVGYDGRSPDTKDAALATQANNPVHSNTAANTASEPPLNGVGHDGRSPDTIDAAIQAHLPVVTVFRTEGFQWGDFAIGVATALGLMLLLGLSLRLLTNRHASKQPGPVATA
jgi:hypothetical protein